MQKRRFTAILEKIKVLDLKNKPLNFSFWKRFESKRFKKLFLYIASIKFTQDYFLGFS